MDPGYAENYERLYREHWWWRARERFILSLLHSTSLAKNGNVLDIGCGGGWSFEQLAEFGDVSGVETDAALVESAGARRDRIYNGPFDRRFQPDRQFSLIVMLDVLEHMADPQSAMDYAVELLQPKGKLFMTVPAMPILWTTHDDLNHHYVRYTKSSLRPIAENAGLRIERLQYFFHWLTPLKLLIRLKEQAIKTPPANPSVPPPLLNCLFATITRLEQSLLKHVPLPFGSSLLCIGSRR